MSGHSKWSNIKNRKGAQDKLRSVAFTKMSKNIITAIKMGGSTKPESNSYLRAVLEKAREVNMPKDNIARLIERFEQRKDNLQSFYLEGFGPYGVPIILDVETDNRNRILGEIRLIFKKNAGTLGEEGSVGYLFNRVGEIEFESLSSDDELWLIDNGVEDIDENIVTVEIDKMSELVKLVKLKELAMISNKIIMKPISPIELFKEEEAVSVIDLLEELDEQDDVNGVFAGFTYNE